MSDKDSAGCNRTLWRSTKLAPLAPPAPQPEVSLYLSSFRPRDVTYCAARLTTTINLFTIANGPWSHTNSIMAANKALLKEIGQDIQRSKFSDAISKANQVLERDAKNYQALVFHQTVLEEKKYHD
jgi:hypothetical protein